MQSLLQQMGGMGGAAAPQAPAALVKFKAGKMEMQSKGDNKFLIVPDLRKGEVSLFKGDDQLLHFQWKDRKTQALVDDLILFPDDAVFKRVKTGKEEDRVYLLQYKGSDRRFFFWMQDKDGAKDVEHCADVNKYMSNPDAAPGGAGSGGEAAGGVDLLRGLTSGGVVRGAAAGGGGAGAAAAAAGGNVQVADLQSILQSLGMPAAAAAAAAPPAAAAAAGAEGAGGAAAAAAAPPAPAPAAAAPAAGAGAGAGAGISQTDLQSAMANIFAGAARSPSMSLNDVVNADEVLASGVLGEAGIEETLLALLPEGQRTPEELRALVSGPQFQQALASLTSALAGDNFNAVMSSFGIDPSPGMAALAQGNGVRAFLDALVAQYGGDAAEQQQQQQQQEEREGDDEGKEK